MWHRPVQMPLVTPGMPWICVTLLATKYLSQVALSKDESQNMLHSCVVTVPLAVSTVLAHTSNVFHTNVRLPSKQTLEEGQKKKKQSLSTCLTLVIATETAWCLHSLFAVQWKSCISK